MPIPISAFKLSCTACDWSKVVAPKSDVLTRGQAPIECPSCGCTELRRENPSVFEKAWAEITSKP